MSAIFFRATGKYLSIHHPDQLDQVYKSSGNGTKYCLDVGVRTILEELQHLEKIGNGEGAIGVEVTKLDGC